MTKKTRYFVLAAGAVLVVGLGGALVAYLMYNRSAALPDGLPAELQYVPDKVALVAFADVRRVMDSDLHRSLTPGTDPDSRKGRQMMHDFTGVDIEKQVNRVVAYVEPYTPPDPQAQAKPEMPRALVLVNGSFDPARIEASIGARGGNMEDYKGRKLFLHRESNHDLAVGLVSSDLIAMGQADLVKRVIDLSQDSSGLAPNITTNADIMTLVRDNAGSTAWVVGQFDEISRRLRLPSAVAGQVPPVRLMSAKADINGGVKATIRAEAGDKAAADQLRDVVRGFISLMRLQASGKPQLENTLKTIELSGSDSTVRMSFAVSPETLKVIVPRQRGGGPPTAPPPPGPPK